MFDCIIIGNGPAGVSAALYLLRAGYKTVIIGKDGGALQRADKIQNYFGTEQIVSGDTLLENGKNQVEALGGIFYSDEVIGINYDGDFTVHIKSQSVKAKSVILATGMERKKSNVKDIEKYEGKGVSYCAICDAFFYRGKDVAVLGNGAYAMHEVVDLLPIANSVTLLTNGAKPDADFPEKVNIITQKVNRVFGDGKVEGVELENGEKVSVGGIFVALGSASGSDLAKKIGVVVEDNKIIVDNEMATMLPGLYAAGDCIGGIQQVSVAVGEGATAGLSAIKYLKKAK